MGYLDTSGRITLTRVYLVRAVKRGGRSMFKTKKFVRRVLEGGCVIGLIVGAFEILKMATGGKYILILAGIAGMALIAYLIGYVIED